MNEPLTNFARGAYLVLFGVLAAWIGFEIQTDNCGFFGSSLVCGTGGLIILAAAAILVVGAAYVVLSSFDLYRDWHR